MAGVQAGLGHDGGGGQENRLLGIALGRPLLERDLRAFSGRRSSEQWIEGDHCQSVHPLPVFRRAESREVRAGVKTSAKFDANQFG